MTYRIFDYNRKDNAGNERELHTEQAMDVIDFSFQKEYKTMYNIEKNTSSEIVSCDYFTTNILEFTQELDKDYNQLDSFIIYMTMEGSFEINWEEGKEIINKGETVLIPSGLESIQLKPKSENVKLLEVYIK